ncbi:MAG: hypothetical protein AB1546_15250 [bacterium]
MVTLTDEEREIMLWSAEAFKAPWLGLTERFQRINSGEKIDREEALVDTYFLPFKADARLIYRILKSGGKRALFGDNGSMLTVVTNLRGNRIIWAALELEEDGVYTEFHALKDRLGQEWDARGAELLYDNLMAEAFEHFKAWVKSQEDLQHIDIGILKVASINFFGAFKTAYEESGNGEKIASLTVNITNALHQIFEEGWIRFYPEVNLKKLFDMAAPVLSLMSPVNAGLAKILSKLPF